MQREHLSMSRREVSTCLQFGAVTVHKLGTSHKHCFSANFNEYEELVTCDDNSCSNLAFLCTAYLRQPSNLHGGSQVGVITVQILQTCNLSWRRTQTIPKVLCQILVSPLQGVLLGCFSRSPNTAD